MERETGGPGGECGGGLDFSQPQFYPDYAGSAARFVLNDPVHNSMTETTGAGGLSGNTMCHNSVSFRNSNEGVFYQAQSTPALLYDTRRAGKRGMERSILQPELGYINRILFPCF